jgi:hypothetical protein
MKKDNRHPEQQYLDLLQDILDNGTVKHDHNTGVGLTSVFGRQMRFDLSKGFPLLTTKKVPWNSIMHELYWFMSGQTNIKYLVDNKVPIWNDYPYKIYKKKADKGEFPQLSLEEFAHTSTTQVENGGDQMIGSGEIGAESLFSPLIEGGRVDVGDPNSLEDTRIIYAGTFLKAKKPEVYFFGQDSRLHFVPRSDVLRSWIAAGANIEEVPQATIDQIDHGEDLPYRPRTVLIRTSESSAVYAVTGQQQVQWIPTESLAEETYGPTWRRLIRVLTSQEFSQYRLEAPLFSATEIPALDTRAEWVDPSDAF